MNAPQIAPPCAPDPRPRLLLIDDDEMVLRAITRLLRHDAAVCACAGPEAAEAALDTGDHFDLLLTDLGLGAESGVDVLERLTHRFGPQLPRAGVFSGRAPTDDERRRLDALPLPVVIVQKPAGRAVLVAALASARA
ncbi:MAG: response regulator [Deltaproteobacteria bacterium]|jgi:CheY-like chemotaxis protein|nr:response regulator [Deltaproteobacteria bacterium]